MAKSREQEQDWNEPQSPRSRRNLTTDMSNVFLGKVPPQAPDLEQAVLGALMIDRDALSSVVDILKVESFYNESHQIIYKAITELFRSTRPIDMLTVTEELRKMGALEKAGGAFYIVELVQRVASSANIEYHARIIAQKYIQRSLIRVSTEIIRDAFEDTTDVFDLMDKAEQNLFSITETNLSRSFEGLNTLAPKLLKQIEELSKKADGLTGVPSGFTKLDRITAGWQPSDLIIMAARPAMGKCLGRGTKVMMFDGSLKNVEAVQIGDLLMGDDSTPRKVLSLARGREQMYWVRQLHGIDYRVNESHILSLKRSRNEGKNLNGNVLNIEVKDYLIKSAKWKTNYKGYKVGVEFAETPLSIDPYFFGLWLGDGKKTSSRIYTMDKEVVDFLQHYADDLGHHLAVTDLERCPGYTIKHSFGKDAPIDSLQAKLRNINVLNNKHIPHNFIANSRKNRLALLAGLIDSDGHLNNGYGGTYEITSKYEHLAQQIKYLCDTLGYRTSLKAKRASIKEIGFETTVWRVRFNGNVDEIPVRVARKKASAWTNPCNWQVTGIDLQKDIIDEYFGFEIDGNRLFLLEDGTVTHNTALTLSLAKNAAMEFNKPVAFFSLEMSSLQLVQRLISSEAEISQDRLRTGQLENAEWQKLQMAIERMSKTPIFIDDTPAINIFELRAKCRRLKAQHDIQLIIIDYLQLMTGGGGGDKRSMGNREQEISSISRGLKGLAKELNVPVIALSQLSRAVESRGGSKKPQLSDLRECVTGDTQIALLDGRQMRIADLVGQTPKVLSIDPSSEKIVEATTNMIWSVGKKEVFEVKLASGRSIKASAEHRLYTFEGWKTIQALQKEERIATARYLPQPTECITIDDAKNDLFWDTITAITPCGEQEVFDVSVPETAAWIANGIISHNSGAIEQDADIVSFIYRPEYYNITEDENGNSTKGIAEVIIAKHRNGSLDDVRLRFIGEYSKFTDAEDFNFGDFGDLDPSDDFPRNNFGGGNDFGGSQNASNNTITLSSRMNDDDIPF